MSCQAHAERMWERLQVLLECKLCRGTHDRRRVSNSVITAYAGVFHLALESSTALLHPNRGDTLSADSRKTP